MRNKVIEKLEHFVERTSMHVYPINKTSIVSYINGFQLGINDDIFTNELKKYLESEHNIYGSNPGWPRQIMLYAKRKKLKWNEAFMEIAKIVLERIKKMN